MNEQPDNQQPDDEPSDRFSNDQSQGHQSQDHRAGDPEADNSETNNSEAGNSEAGNSEYMAPEHASPEVQEGTGLPNETKLQRQLLEEKVSAYLDGELSPEEQNVVKELLANDRAALDIYNDYRQMGEWLQKMPQISIDTNEKTFGEPQLGEVAQSGGKAPLLHSGKTTSEKSTSAELSDQPFHERVVSMATKRKEYFQSITTSSNADKEARHKEDLLWLKTTPALLAMAATLFLMFYFPLDRPAGNDFAQNESTGKSDHVTGSIDSKGSTGPPTPDNALEGRPQTTNLKKGELPINEEGSKLLGPGSVPTKKDDPRTLEIESQNKGGDQVNKVMTRAQKNSRGGNKEISIRDNQDDTAARSRGSGGPGSAGRRSAEGALGGGGRMGGRNKNNMIATTEVEKADESDRTKQSGNKNEESGNKNEDRHQNSGGQVGGRRAENQKVDDPEINKKINQEIDKQRMNRLRLGAQGRAFSALPLVTTEQTSALSPLKVTLHLQRQNSDPILDLLMQQNVLLADSNETPLSSVEVVAVELNGKAAASLLAELVQEKSGVVALSAHWQEGRQNTRGGQKATHNDIDNQSVDHTNTDRDFARNSDHNNFGQNRGGHDELRHNHFKPYYGIKISKPTRKELLRYRDFFRANIQAKTIEEQSVDSKDLGGENAEGERLDSKNIEKATLDENVGGQDLEGVTFESGFLGTVDRGTAIGETANRNTGNRRRQEGINLLPHILHREGDRPVDLTLVIEKISGQNTPDVNGHMDAQKGNATDGTPKVENPVEVLPEGGEFKEKKEASPDKGQLPKTDLGKNPQKKIEGQGIPEGPKTKKQGKG
ncbi:MAG: zf-HC2 domain-containing protein [Pirellulaceae bacterium]|nr:zf-HC2 domain-containing protein [Pirellulaceae bacterium]